MVPIAQREEWLGENVTLKKEEEEEGGRQCDAVIVMEEERKCCSCKEARTERVKIMCNHISLSPLVQ